MQERRELSGRVALHRRQYMCVRVQRRADLPMAKSFLNDFRRHAGRQEQRRARVPQPVKLNRPHVGRPDEPRVLPLTKVIDLERFARHFGFMASAVLTTEQAVQAMAAA